MPATITRPNRFRWSTPSLLVTCLALGLVGWMIGRNQRTPTPPAPLAGPSQTPPVTSRISGSDSESDKTAASTAASSTAQNPGDNWRDLLAQPSTPARDRALIALLEQLAKTDPAGALALAAAQPNWRLRDELRDASLRGWAAADSNAAGDWSLKLRPEDRRRAVAAVLQGAASTQPDAAVRTALRLCLADPEPSGDYGHATIAALVQNGAFAEAVRFGNELGADKYPFILKSAYSEWALRQPAAALESLMSIRDPATRSAAASQVYSGWARADARGLATYALTLPAGEARTQALAEALPHWVEKDPVTATAWINENDTGGDFDDGAAAVANLQTLVTRQPAKAIEWATTIDDPGKREQTLRTVFRQWAEKDPAAARQFAEKTTDPQNRSILTSELKNMSPDS